MIYATDQVRHAATAARVLASVLLVIALRNLVVGVSTSASTSTHQEAIGIVGVVVAVYAWAAGLLFWFAAEMLKVRRWAAIGALSTSLVLALLCALSAIRLGGSVTPLVQLVVMLPAAVTAILCARALRDITPRANTALRGRPVAKTPPPPARMPIPPAASRLAPRRGNHERSAVQPNQPAKVDATRTEEDEAGNVTH